jgi:hypothetical protein
MPGGEARLANLRLLIEHAMSFEETRLTGLFNFTRYIFALHEARSDERVGTAAPATSADCVRLMSIHKSKGLEFPIVFVSFLGRKFNVEDEKQSVILHSEAGAGTYYTDTALRTRANTLPRYTLSRLTRRENRAEELRCLYVAMTRAMQTLILTARCADYDRAVQKWSDPPPPASFLDWLAPCVIGGEIPATDKVPPTGEVGLSGEVPPTDEVRLPGELPPLGEIRSEGSVVFVRYAAPIAPLVSREKAPAIMRSAAHAIRSLKTHFARCLFSPQRSAWQFQLVDAT